jgi:hypothetical protein
MVRFTPSTAKVPEAKERSHPFEEDWRGADADRPGAKEDSSGG